MFGRNVHTFKFSEFEKMGKIRPPTAPDYAAAPGKAIYFFGVKSNNNNCTRGQIRKKYRINSHLITHFLTSEGVSKVSEKANE